VALASSPNFFLKGVLEASSLKNGSILAGKAVLSLALLTFADGSAVSEAHLTELGVRHQWQVRVQVITTCLSTSFR
jgi:hypothetical protein